jgi:hypothetical protein
MYRWYDASTGGNLLFEGNPFISSPLLNTTTFFVEAYSNASGGAGGGSMVSRALQFPGGGNYIDCGNPPGNLFDLLGDGTLEAWVKPQDTLPSYGSFDVKVVLGKDEGPLTVPKWFFAIQDGGLVFHMGSGPSYPPGPFLYSDTFPQPPVDSFYHVAISKKSDTIFYYVNGTPVGESILPIPFVPQNAPLTIGYAEPCCQFDGVIDDVKFWNVARTSGQILQDMTQCPDTTDLNLIAYYPMDDSIGQSVVKDLSAYGNDGLLTNMDPTTSWVDGVETECNSSCATASERIPVVAFVSSGPECNQSGTGTCQFDTTAFLAVQSQIDTFFIDLNAGDQLRIQANFIISSHHEQLDLYGPDGSLLETLITASGELAVLTRSITQSGEYVLVFSEAEGDDTGSYGLSIQVTNSPSCALAIACGYDETHFLGNYAEMDAYSFPLSAGDSLRIQANFIISSHHEQLDLYGPDGSLLETLITASGELAVLTRSITQSGEYVLVFSEAEGDDTGSYGLSIQVTNSPSCALAIACGYDETHFLGNYAEMDAYSFPLSAGDSLRIHANFIISSHHEQLDLYGPDGSLLETLITASGELAVLTRSITQSGEYVLVFSEAEGDDTGSYGLSIQVTNSPSCALAIACGYDETHFLGNYAEMDAYSFTLSAGDSLRIHANFIISSHHEQLDLYGPDGSLLETLITASGELAVLTRSITQSGEYVLVFSEAEGDDTGSYGLSIQVTNSPSCALAIACGYDETHFLGNYAEMDAYSFTLSAGDSLRIHANFIISSHHEQLDLYGPDGALLETLITASDELAVLTRSIIQSGEYVLVVSEAEGDDTGSYGLSVEVTNSADCLLKVGCLNDTIGFLGNYAEMDGYWIDLSQGDQLYLQMDFIIGSHHERIDVFYPDGTFWKTIVTGSNQTAILDEVIPLTGTYFIIVSEAEGDDTGSYGFSVRINGQLIDYPVPDPQIIASLQNLCPGEIALLEVDDVYPSYHWSTGENTPSIQVSSPGDYAITVTNTFGCPGEDQIEILQADSLLCDTALACPDTLLIDESPTTDTLYQAADLVTTEGIVEIVNGLHVVLQAGKEVSLKPGFYAAINADCTIKIQECAEVFTGDLPEIPASATVEEDERQAGLDREDSASTESAKGFITAVFPNPARDEVTVTFERLEETVRLTITDLTGRSHQNLFVPALTERLQLNLSRIPSGVYILHFQGQSGNKVVRKIVKVGY